MNETTGTNTFLHIIGTAWEARHLIAAQSLLGTATQFGGLNTAQVAATAGDFAALSLFLVSDASTSKALGVQRQAVSLSNAAAVTGTLAAAFNVFAINGCVVAAGAAVHASSTITTITHDVCC